MFSRFSLVLVAFTLVGSLFLSCGKEQKEVPSYTIAQLMDIPRLVGGSFSYDESHVLYSSDESGIFNCYVRSIGDSTTKQVTTSKDNANLALSFFPDDNRILFAADSAGDERYHIFVRDERGVVTDVTPVPGSKASFEGWTYDGNAFIASWNKRDQQIMDVYLFDVNSLKPDILFKNDSLLNYESISNNKRYLAFSKEITSSVSTTYLYDRETESLRRLFPPDRDATNRPAQFSFNSRSLYVLTNKDSEFLYLQRYDIETGAVETVHEEPWDITSFRISPNGHYMALTIDEDAVNKLKLFDLQSGQPVTLPGLPDGTLSRIRFSPNESYFLMYRTTSNAPRDLYLYDFKTDSSLQLTNTLGGTIDPEELAKAKVVRYPSFDSLEIPAMLYVPHNAKKDHALPAVVTVHGGPGGQARPVYSALTQYLVNHGYAVIDVNNRGSHGYGKTFFRLDDMRHGEDDLQDCIYAKRFLAASGYVDTSRVAILGGSYGGYMTLAALTFAPEEFAAGVDIFGISNWVRTLESIPPWWESIREALYTEMGNPETDRQYLESISPLFHAENIVKPMLVIQGANDPRVIKVESDDIVKAARANGVPVEYIVFDDEGHGFLKKENELEAYQSILVFLDSYLKNSADEGA